MELYITRIMGIIWEASLKLNLEISLVLLSNKNAICFSLLFNFYIIQAYEYYNLSRILKWWKSFQLYMLKVT